MIATVHLTHAYIVMMCMLSILYTCTYVRIQVNVHVCLCVHNSPTVVQCVQWGVVLGRGPLGEAPTPVKHTFIHCRISEHMHRQILSRSATGEEDEHKEQLMHSKWHKR